MQLHYCFVLMSTLLKVQSFTKRDFVMHIYRMLRYHVYQEIWAASLPSAPLTLKVTFLPLPSLHKYFHCILDCQKGCLWYSAGSDVIETHAMAWNLKLLHNHVSRGK